LIALILNVHPFSAERVLHRAFSEENLFRRRAATQQTLSRKTRLLRKIGPMAMRSSVAGKIVLVTAHLAMIDNARSGDSVAECAARHSRKNAACDPGLGSISSSRCQKSRMPLHREGMHAKLFMLRGQI